MQSLQGLPKVCPRQARRPVHRWNEEIHVEVRRQTQPVRVYQHGGLLRTRIVPVRPQVRPGHSRLHRYLQRRLPRLLVDPTQRLWQPGSGQLPLKRRHPSRTPVLRRLRSRIVSWKKIHAFFKLQQKLFKTSSKTQFLATGSDSTRSNAALPLMATPVLSKTTTNHANKEDTLIF